MPAPDAYEIGEIVYCREPLINDGGIPDVAADALLATPGQRGVVVNAGHAEFDPGQAIYLVRFEIEGGLLGPPVGCLPDELTQDEAWARAVGTAGGAS